MTTRLHLAAAAALPDGTAFDVLDIDPEALAGLIAAGHAAVSVREVPDELVLQLRKPVSIGQQEYREIKLTEPDVAQLVQASRTGSPLEQTAAMINLNGKVPKAVVDRLSQRDFMAAADFFARFSDDTTPAP